MRVGSNARQIILTLLLIRLSSTKYFIFFSRIARTFLGWLLSAMMLTRFDKPGVKQASQLAVRGARKLVEGSV